MIFISYSSLDYEQATEVKNVLTSNGFNCWMAPEGIPIGSNYALEIPTAVQACTTFLLILSDKSQESKWVPKELDMAINLGKLIVPFHLDESMLRAPFNFYLTNIQRIEAYNRLENGYVELISRLKKTEPEGEVKDIVTVEKQGMNVENAKSVLASIVSREATQTTDDRMEYGKIKEYTSDAFGGWIQPSESSKSIELFSGTASTDEQFLDISIPFGCDITGKEISYSFSEHGSIAIVGEAGSGKSTLLQSMVSALIKKYTPEQINLYCVDFNVGGMECFASAPQVCNVFYEEDLPKMDRLIFHFDKLLSQRKKIFRRFSFAQYIEDNNTDVPAIILCIDCINKLMDSFDGIRDWFIKLIREGERCGIYLLISDYNIGPRGIPVAIADSIKSKICLSLRETYDYIDVFHKKGFKVSDEKKPKGWGIICKDEDLTEFVTVPAFGNQSEMKRYNEVASLCDKVSQAWKKERPKGIVILSGELSWDQYLQYPNVQEAIDDPDTLPFGISEKTGEIIQSELKNLYCYAIKGAGRTGKTTMLKCILKTVLEKRKRNVFEVEPKIVVIENEGATLKSFSEANDIIYLTTQKEIFDFFAETIPTYKERNAMKHHILGEGGNEDQVYEEVKHLQPYFIFIADLGIFIKEALQPSDGGEKYNYDAFLQNIWGKGMYHGFYYFAGADDSKLAESEHSALQKIYFGYAAGMRVGGQFSLERHLNFEDIPYMEQSKAYPPGVFYTGRISERPAEKGRFAKV